MAKIIVQNFKEKQTSNGKTIYKCSGTIDGDVDFFDMWSLPEVGKELEGTVKETQYGKSVSLARPGGFGGGGSRFNDPETRKEIIRQSSLAQAVAFASKKVEFMEPSEATGYLNGKHILQIATYFAAYAEGRLTVAMSDEDVIALLTSPGSFEPAEATKAAHRAAAQEPEADDEPPFDEEPAWLKEGR